jgi:hypothetical protein
MQVYQLMQSLAAIQLLSYLCRLEHCCQARPLEALVESSYAGSSLFTLPTHDRPDHLCYYNLVTSAMLGGQQLVDSRCGQIIYRQLKWCSYTGGRCRHKCKALSLDDGLHKTTPAAKHG